jgi:hypothetical protein
MATHVTLKCANGITFDVPIECAKLSGTIFDAYEAFFNGETQEETLKTMDIREEICSNTIKHITNFLKLCTEHPLEAIDKDSYIDPIFAKNVSKHGDVYVKFMEEINGGTTGINDGVYRLKYAADFMHVQPLLELISLFQTCQLEPCTTTEEVLTLLRIPPFTNQEEEDEYRNKCAWMFRFPSTTATP